MSKDEYFDRCRRLSGGRSDVADCKAVFAFQSSSCATPLTKSGAKVRRRWCSISMKQVQEWLGHSTFSTTADIYAHLDYKSKQGSAGVIANLLGESKLPK